VTGFDYGLLAILGVSCFLGFKRGLIKELLSLVSFALAGLASIWWGPSVANHPLLQWASNEYLRLGIAYVLLFILVLVSVGLLNMTLSGFLRGAGLTPADRGLGGLYGLIRGLLITLVLVIVLGYTPVPKQAWWTNAMFSSAIVGAMQQIKARVPEPVNEWLPY